MIKDAVKGTSTILTSTIVRLLGPRDLVFEQEQIDIAAIGPDDIVVATEFSAISPGTELSAYLGLPPLRPGPVYPRYLGYCNCGNVIAIGSNVKTVAAGDRVLTNAAHRSHYRIDQSEIITKVPAGMNGADASVTYLFHLGYAALLRANVRIGQRVAVVGLGALGIGAIAVSHAAGAEVVAISARERALSRSRRLGAVMTCGPDDDAVNSVKADVVISTSNNWRDWSVALRAARRGGAIAVLGFPGRGEPPPESNPLDSQYFYDKQLTLMAVGQLLDEVPGSRSPSPRLRVNMKYLVDLISAGRLPVKELAGHLRPAHELKQVYEDLLARREEDIPTYVLQWAA
jgi:2-desacetyl-2-hydroxyethyl bacteriochlorophyllide A dehydrogenase